jgi:hypothetical protein
MLLLVILGLFSTAARRLPLMALLAFSALSAAADEARLPRFVPDVEKVEELVLQGSTWTYGGETFAINLRRVNDQERLNYIERMTGVAIDPFATRPGYDPRFMSFLLVIENNGEGSIGFNALDSWLKTNHSQLETPLGVTDLSFAYHTSGRDFPAAYERVGRVMLDGSRTIQPGASLSGLLIYHVVEPTTRRFIVDVDLVLPTGDVEKFSAPYRREKKKKDGDDGGKKDG